VVLYQYLKDDSYRRQEPTAFSNGVKGDAYEGLLEKNAQDDKEFPIADFGLGIVYCKSKFKTHPLIQAMVDVVQPKPKETFCDPACGTGGLFTNEYSHVASISDTAWPLPYRVHILGHCMVTS